MAKVQTRKSISISAAMYERMQEAAASRGISVSRLTELAVARSLESDARDRDAPVQQHAAASRDDQATG